MDDSSMCLLLRLRQGFSSSGLVVNSSPGCTDTFTSFGSRVVIRFPMESTSYTATRTCICSEYVYTPPFLRSDSAYLLSVLKNFLKLVFPMLDLNFQLSIFMQWVIPEKIHTHPPPPPPPPTDGVLEILTGGWSKALAILAGGGVWT